jgi:hypothetical protein
MLGQEQVTNVVTSMPSWLGSLPCEDSFIRRHGANYEEIDQESLEAISHLKSNGEHDASMSLQDVAAGPPDWRYRVQT